MSKIHAKERTLAAFRDEYNNDITFVVSSPSYVVRAFCTVTGDFLGYVEDDGRIVPPVSKQDACEMLARALRRRE